MIKKKKREKIEKPNRINLKGILTVITFLIVVFNFYSAKNIYLGFIENYAIGKIGLVLVFPVSKRLTLVSLALLSSLNKSIILMNSQSIME